MCDTSRTACLITVSPVICTGLLNALSVNGVGTLPLNPKRDQRLNATDKYNVRIGTQIAGKLTSRSIEKEKTK